MRNAVTWIVVLGLLISAWALTAAAADPDQPIEPPAAKAGKSKRPAVAKFPQPRIFPEPTAVERRIAAVLEEPTDVNWIDAPLGDIAVELTDKYELPVQFDMAALTADGRGSETLVNKSLRGVPLKNLLRSVLDDLDLTFVVRHDQLLITSKTAAENYVRVRVYQVHDLVLQANDLAAGYPDFDSLIELIGSTIAPESWREVGGTQGEIKPYYGSGVIGLIITQTDEAHAKIEELLASMRAAQADPIREAQSQRPPGAGSAAGSSRTAPRAPPRAPATQQGGGLF